MKIHKALFVFAISCFLFAEKANAQSFNPAHWTYSLIDLNNDNYNIELTVTLDEGWHIFSKDYVGISVPATLSFELNDGFEFAGPVMEQGELIKEEIDISGEKEIALYYKNKVVYSRQIKLLKQEAVVRGVIEYMTCKEVCIPPAYFEFEITLKQ